MPSGGRPPFLLDGYPRTAGQAARLDAFLAAAGTALNGVLVLTAPDEVLRERLRSRASIEGRADDTDGVIQSRLATHHELTTPVIEHYRASGLTVEVDATADVDAVWAAVSSALSHLSGLRSR